MLWLEIIVVLGAIFFGARLGSIGIGYAGGLGVLILTLGMGLKLGAMPIDVILIIMSVIAAIAAIGFAGRGEADARTVAELGIVAVIDQTHTGVAGHCDFGDCDASGHRHDERGGRKQNLFHGVPSCLSV